MTEIVNNILLSHHLDDEIDNCTTISFRGFRYYFCVRCFSAIVVTILTIPLHVFFPLLYPPMLLLLAFPDWIARQFGYWRGNNFIRAFSGVLLGTSYSLNIVELFSLQFRAVVWSANLVAVVLYVVTLRCTWNIRGRAITKRCTSVAK